MAFPSVRAAALTALIAAPCAPASAQAVQSVPAWAFPGPREVTATLTHADSVAPRRVHGSNRAFSLAQALNDMHAPVDWYPATHPRAPRIVMHGAKGTVFACAYCHLPDGAGRSENAMLAGLPADYIVREVHDIRAHLRAPAIPAWPFAKNMLLVADGVSEDDLRAAARYYSRLTAMRRYRVVERDSVPRTQSIGGVLAVNASEGREPLGQRIVEVSNDARRHELHDARETFTSYVPMGSIARGRKIATATGAKAATACVTCHGPKLTGKAPAPPIAGRSPLYIMRQLLGFKTGTRTGPNSVPMQTVAPALSVDDMIAVAAYVGSRTP